MNGKTYIKPPELQFEHIYPTTSIQEELFYASHGGTVDFRYFAHGEPNGLYWMLTSLDRYSMLERLRQRLSNLVRYL